jgi:streptogramin lyase
MRRIALAAGLLLLVSLPAAAGAAGPEYLPFPAGYTGGTFGVAADEQGDVWFGAGGPAHTNANPPPNNAQPTPTLARLVPAQAHAGTSDGLTFYPTPDAAGVSCCANQLRSVAYNATDHKLYWVRSDGHLGSGDPTTFVPGTSTSMTTVRLPGDDDLWDVVAAKGPGVWFTEKTGSNVGPGYEGSRIAFSTGGAPTEGPNIAIQNGNTTINSLRYDAKPSGIAVAADGRPWFVEEDPGNPGYRIATYSGAGSSYDEFQVSPCEAAAPCSGSYTGTGLTDLAIAPDGGIWFTNVINRKFGRFDPATHTMVQYTMASIGLAAGDPRQMTAAPDGTIWMTSYQASGGASSALVRIVPGTGPAQAPTYTIYATPGTTALGLAADQAGSIWFTTTGTGATHMVGRLAGVVGGAPAGGGGAGGGAGGGGGGGGSPSTPAPASPAPAATPTAPPAVLKPDTVGTARLDPPQVGNGAINTNQVCVGPPQARCSLVYLVREHEYVTGFPSANHKKKKPKHKPRTLATKAVTLKGGEKRKVTITLNALGRRILRGKGSFRVDFIVTQKLAGGKTRTVSRRTLTMKAKARKRARR